jgi:Mg-chelatase subunit ChlD
MCNVICQEMGRHVHIDYCRENTGLCQNTPDLQHIKTPLFPNPDRPKDWVTHSLFWRRTGFKDPYSRDDQASFAKCDAMCPGPEHTNTASGPPQASYCTLPHFHPHQTQVQGTQGLGYASNDGHLFSCKNPVQMQQAYHVIFVIDRSGSMSITDRRPLPGSPATGLITQHANNRLGAVYSSLYGFWSARNAAITAGRSATVRRDAYTVILFNEAASTCIANDFTNAPNELLSGVVRYPAGGGTDFAAALESARAKMVQHWSTERAPVVIFLSDGECSVPTTTVQDLCLNAIALGKPLSFHTVSFGTATRSSSLATMARIALDIQNSAPRDLLTPAGVVLSSYADALDTVQLAETFLGIAESLRKPRGSLIR